MEKWRIWLVNPAAAYFIYLGLLMPFVGGENGNILIVVGVPFAISLAYLWHRARLAGILPCKKPPSTGAVEAGEFVLKDMNGRTRAVLGVTDNGPGLDLYDADGAVRAWMGLLADMPGLTLSDGEGASKVQLSALADGPHIVLYDANHKLRAVLDVLPEGPRLELYDRDCTSRAKLVVFGDGVHFGLSDANGKASYSAP